VRPLLRIMFPLIGISGLILGAGGRASGCPAAWEAYTSITITGGGITAPVGGQGYACNSEVACTISGAIDFDHKHAPSETPVDTFPEDTLTYTWSASGDAGSWKNGDNTGTSVTWMAPSTASSGITITCTITDPPGPHVGDDTGTRDDADVTRSVTVKVIKVDIKQGANTITDQTQDTIVGRNIALQGVVSPAGMTVTARQWSVPGNRIANYTADANSATVTALTDVTGSTVSYYWVGGGDGREVTYTATVNGQQFSAKTTFNVKRPTCTITPATESSVAVRADYLGQSGIHLSFGGGTNPSPPPGYLYGVRFKYTKVTMPEGFDPGQWQYVQTLNAYNLRQFNSEPGNWYGWYTGGNWVLDTQYPYLGSWSTGNDEHEAVDAPATPDMSNSLGDPPVVLYKRYIMDEYSQGFRMYIMFKPSGAGSIWVPLKRVAWGWKGSATKDSEDQWSLDYGSNDTKVGSADDETTHPEWNQSTEDINWQPL